MKKAISVILIYLLLHSCLAPNRITESSGFFPSSDTPTKDSSLALLDANPQSEPNGADFISGNKTTDLSGSNIKPNNINSLKDAHNYSISCDSSIVNKYIATSTKTYTNEGGEVELFFDGVYVEYEFEQIGFIEIFGNENSKTEELLECLKYQAYNHGADAVISVKKETIFKRENDIKYSLPAFSGVAIKFYTVDDVVEEPIEIIPLSSKYNKVEKEDSLLEQFFTIIGGAVFFAVYLWLDHNILVEDEEECCY